MPRDAGISLGNGDTERAEGRVNSLTAIGISLTVAWMGTFVTLAAYRFGALSEMTLNEFGDFLAGASAPVALLWLVVGYFQQGRELRLNTRALEAQERELRRQVSATVELAENSAREARATEDLADATKASRERAEARESEEAQPVFEGAGSFKSETVIDIKVKNRGGDARDLEIVDGDAQRLSWNRPHFGSGDRGNLRVRPGPRGWEFPKRFRFRYRDRFGEQRYREMEVDGDQLIDVDTPYTALRRDGSEASSGKTDEVMREGE